MHRENPKLKYNQTIVTWKGLHQHPIRNSATHHVLGWPHASITRRPDGYKGTEFTTLKSSQSLLEEHNRSVDTG
jgi:hypothetical protein